VKYLDVVKIIKLLESERHFDGSPSVMRPPEKGDIGTIVEVFQTSQKVAYCVECVDNEGCTIWLADFLPEEIQSID
jgi:hypothetical protein